MENLFYFAFDMAVIFTIVWAVGNLLASTIIYFDNDLTNKEEQDNSIAQTTKHKAQENIMETFETLLNEYLQGNIDISDYMTLEIALFLIVWMAMIYSCLWFIKNIFIIFLDK